MRNYYILISFMVVLLSPPVIKASYELPADTSDTAAVEEPALPVFTAVPDEPEMPVVQEGLTGNEPALPAAVTQPAAVTLIRESAVSSETLTAVPAGLTAAANSAPVYNLEQAKKLYEAGKSLYKKKKYNDALEALQKAEALYIPENIPAGLTKMLSSCKTKAGDRPVTNK